MTVSVDGIRLDVAVIVIGVAVLVIVTVLSVGKMEAVSETVGVFEGAGLLVGVAVPVGLGVKEGMRVGSTVPVGRGVDVAAVTCAGSGEPDPIKRTRMPENSRTMIPLKTIPWVVGRSFIAKRVNKPRMLANAKWTTKTKIPWGQMPATPEPSPKPPALMGK